MPEIFTRPEPHVVALVGVMLLLAAASAHAERRLAVAWNDGAQSGVVQAMESESPWEFVPPPQSISAGAVLRFAGQRLYVVEPAADRIRVFDASGLSLLDSVALDEGCEPRDIAVVAPDRAFVSCYSRTGLLRLNPQTGDVVESVDLGVLADPDGVPDMNTMAVHGDRLFVQLQRYDENLGFVPPAMLAVIDIPSETLIDVDPGEPGVQAIELVGAWPKRKMQVVEATSQLFVSASGELFDAGGLERIDLVELQTLGLVVTETSGEIGADLGSFVMTTATEGYLEYTTDFGISSHLTRFTTAGEVELEALLETVGYRVPNMVHDPETGYLFVPELLGMHVFDAATGERLTGTPVATSGLPTDVVLLAEPSSTSVSSTTADHPARLAARAYPNPFNPAVTIDVDVPLAAPVELSVYDASGRLLRAVRVGRRALGSYTFIWDGRDAKGRALRSGVYFYRVTAASLEHQARVVLVR